jgi:hypothetical protein
MEKKMWFYGQVVEKLKKLLKSPIVERLEMVFRDASNVLTK